MPEPVAAVVIGRNEGERLKRCLATVADQCAIIVYVDSGSTDGSVDAARAMGAEVIGLDLSVPFTAARARNAGLARVTEIDPDGTLIQFLDGDCELDGGWIAAARPVLEQDPGLAVVCGRRREKFPDASIWNRLIDLEWDTPVGEARACGGDALMRRAALADVGGYRDDLIAGEEPEMCYRMRRKGWRIRRIDAEMTRHDAALTRLGQWWKRSRRGGHAFAAVHALHGNGPERFRRIETLRALFWGAAIPLAAFLGAVLLTPWALLVLLAWPAQVIRLMLRGWPFTRSFFLTFGKLPEAQGVLGFWLGRMFGRRQRLIEYK